MHKTQLYHWPDKMLFIGPLADVGPHRHGANAWCFPLERELGFAAGDDQGWRSAGSALIAMGHRHRLHGGDRPVAVLYLHPECDDWRAVAADIGGAGARLLPQAAAAPTRLLNDAYRSQHCSTAAHAELGAELDRMLFSGRRLGAVAADSAVGAAVACLKGRLHENLGLGEIAAAARLSPGRLGHRFSAELGLPLRRFRTWHRLVGALELALRGNSLTAAALDCGFANPAHLSSAFLATFGLPPSAVLRAPGLEFRGAPWRAPQPGTAPPR